MSTISWQCVQLNLWVNIISLYLEVKFIFRHEFHSETKKTLLMLLGLVRGQFTHMNKMWFDFDEDSISSVPLLKLFYYPKVKARSLNSVHNFLRTTVPSNSIICAVCETFLQCPLKKNI